VGDVLFDPELVLELFENDGLQVAGRESHSYTRTIEINREFAHDMDRIGCSLYMGCGGGALIFPAAVRCGGVFMGGAGWNAVGYMACAWSNICFVVKPGSDLFAWKTPRTISVVCFVPCLRKARGTNAILVEREWV
jgi:hypothetical protein